jgi:pyruvate kinase
VDNPPLLIAKIEKPQAVARLSQILAHVDGVMVARGDLGVEMHLEEVPLIQKRIISMARREGKPVITATQMLRSMMDSPRPTRAEANDVANAVLDGTDAVMLSDETAVGSYPVEAVRILDRIARATEPALVENGFLDDRLSQWVPATQGSISRAVCHLAADLQAAVIVACTTSGSSARMVARFRPPQPVLALTDSQEVQRQLALTWGVVPALVPHYEDSEEMFSVAQQWVLDNNLAKHGQRLVITAGVPMGVPGTTNLIKVVDL